MPFVPDWAPNVHPLVVHFPIALTFVALLVDAAALLMRRRTLYAGAAGLYTLAALGALAAFLTGRQAADSVDVSAQAVSTLTRHADLALYAVWVLGLYAVLRLALLWWARRAHPVLEFVAALLGLGGAALVWMTAEQGAALVFAHGVGVQVGGPTADPFDNAARTAQAGSVIRATEQGGWAWQPEAGQGLPPGFEVLHGAATALRATPSQGDTLATFTLHGGPVLLVADPPLAGVQVEALFDLSAFEGTVSIVHHVQDAGHYDFLTFDGDEVVQGRQEGARQQVFARAPIQTAGPMRIRVTAHGRHFYGYVDGESVVHGHGDAPAAGRVGLRVDGAGTLHVGGFIVTPVE